MAAHSTADPIAGTAIMSESFQFLDIILFAMVAAFILLRLRNVLGRRTGHERPPPTTVTPRQVEEIAEKIGHRTEPEAAAAAANEFSDVSDAVLADGFVQIKLADPSFDRVTFLGGAGAAFEVIVEAYAAADAAALRPLLADDVYQPFARAARDRAAVGHSLETEVVSIDEAEIIEAGLSGETASITIRFVSQQISVERDADGDVVSGDPGDAIEVTDIWTFERDTRSRDPNWKLAATRSIN